MKIDKKMNVVVPVDGSGGRLHVHSTPISRQVFERYYSVISKTFAEMYSGGVAYSMMAGPRVAAMILKDVAVKDGSWDGPAGVEHGLISEIRRLSTVVAPTAVGWSDVPLQEALDSGAIDEDDRSEVENALVFFTVVSSMHRKPELGDALDGLSSLWGAQITPLNSTEWRASLATSTATASSGEKAAASSVPS